MSNNVSCLKANFSRTRNFRTAHPVDKNKTHIVPAPQIPSTRPQWDSMTDDPKKIKRLPQRHSSRTVLLMTSSGNAPVTTTL